MKIVALVKPPKDPDAAAKVLASATGIAMAEARMRLAPEPPALLVRLEDEAATALVGTLRKEGIAALAIDARPPDESTRLRAHRFEIADAGLTVTPRSEAPHTFSWGEIAVLLRGQRTARSESSHTEKSTSFSPTAAIATGGLKLTTSKEKTVRSTQEENEQVILVYGRDGTVAALAEGRLDFSCLGKAMSPSRTANMTELWRQLRERAKGAFADDRLLRLGRRPLPFLLGGESRIQAAGVTSTRVDTSGTVDALAEVLFQAVVGRLLP